jgi:hypothetical protein
VEVDEVLQRTSALAWNPLPKPPEIVSANAAVDVLKAGRIAPGQIGVNDLARQIVRRKPLCATLHEGQAGEPAKKLRRQRRIDSIGQKRLCGDPRMRGDLQCRAMRRRRCRLDESVQKLAQDVHVLQRTDTARMHQGVCGNGKCQWMPIGKRNELIALRDRDIAAVKQIVALPVFQVPQPYGAGHGCHVLRREGQRITRGNDQHGLIR